MTTPATRALKTKPYHTWLISKLLKSPSQCARYLTVAFEDSPEVFYAALRNVMEARTTAVVARKAGVCRESLYRNSNPTLKTLTYILRALDMKVLIRTRAIAEQKKDGSQK